ncbi:MAG: molybdopterin-dependent oxidoreductase [Coriobacteriales bacterium]|jgi:molybdopterin-containing oxidoreductase family molybdopterin binding subunit|nr:molybdopterin-dependent oxidoreductase [Coriobacteriales bacterium]
MPETKRKKSGKDRASARRNPTDSGLSRRSFLKATAAVAGTAALGGSWGCSLSDEGMPTASSDELKTGRCMWGGCWACRNQVVVRDGKAVKVETYPHESRRNRACLRGVAQIQRLYNPHRIKYPLKRTSWSPDTPNLQNRGLDEWERITWDEAIGYMAAQFNDVIKKYGSHAFLAITGTGTSGLLNGVYGLGGRLTGILQTSGLESCVDSAIYFGVAKVFGGSGWDFPGNEDELDTLNAKHVFLWGKNLSESAIQQWRLLCDAKEQGARLVLIDPCRTTTANLADIWIPVRPASDAALILAMTNVVLEEGLQDDDYLLSDTVAPYLVRADTKEYLRMSDLGVEPVAGPADAYGQPTTIDPPVVWDSEANAAQSSLESARPELHGSHTVQGHATTTAFDLLASHYRQFTPEKMSELCEVDVETIKMLARLYADGPTSNFPGMGLQAYNNGVQLGFSLGVLIAVTGNMGKPGTGVSNTYFPIPTNIAYNYPTMTFSNSVPILELPNVMATGTWKGEDYPIKALLCEGKNLLNSVVNAKLVKEEVWDKLDFIAVADIAFNETAAQADIVLPIAHYYETEDIYAAGPVYELLHTDKIMEPQFEAKQDGDVYRLLAAQMGIGDYFTRSDEEELRESLNMPQYISAGITLESLRETQTGRWGQPSPPHSDGTYVNATGKAEIYCEKPQPRIEFGQAFDRDAERLPRWFPPTEAWPGSEAMSRYPLILTSERSRHRMQTSGWDVPWHLEIAPEPVLKMNPDDAAARGIKTGDYVEVFNDRGNAVARAALSAHMRPGMLMYPKGLDGSQFKAGSFSHCSTSVYDPVGVNSSFFDCTVEMRLWKEEV